MSRIPLKPGTIVKVNGICYRIEKKIDEGGNSFIYEAVCEEAANARRTVIKEYAKTGGFCIYCQRQSALRSENRIKYIGRSLFDS